MTQELLSFDHELMQWFNAPHLHTLALDQFFYAVSKIFIWLPTFILLLYIIVNTKKRESILIIIGIALVFIITDRITSGLMKPVFARPRPSHDPAIMDMLAYAFNYKGGAFGFPSSHAGNSFAIATFLTLLFRNKALGFTIFSWAVLCSYSRMYLGVHFPSDIFVGATLGTLFGWFSFWFYSKVLKSKFPKLACDDEFSPSQIKALCYCLAAQIFTIASVSVILKQM